MINSKDSIKLINCYGSKGQLLEGKRQVQVTVSEYGNRRRVGCIYLGENGFCNAPGNPEQGVKISRANCVHLRPITENTG
jgi:hypothetical protein